MSEFCHRPSRHTYLCDSIASRATTSVKLTCLFWSISDNDLEWFIREDNFEITQSDLVRIPSVTTWIYFDHRNFGNGWQEDIAEPLENVFNPDGSTITGTKTTLSQYLRWDHTLGKMVVDRTLPFEQDSDSPDVVTDFVTTGVADCVSKGADSFFLAFSSHGGGFYG